MAEPGTYLSHGDDAHLDHLVNDQGLDQVTASRMLWGAPRPEPKPADWTPPALPPVPSPLPRGRWSVGEVFRRVLGGAR